MKKLIAAFIILSGIQQVMAQSVNDGLKDLDFERYESARNIFIKLTQSEPSNGDHQYYLGQAYFYLLQPDSATMAFEAGTKADPVNPANYAGLGWLLLNENKITEAKALFDKALSFSKAKDGSVKDSKALTSVAAAMVMGETKLTDDASKLIEAAIALDKKNYHTLIVAGDVMHERGDGGAAATYYEKAIDLEPTNPKAYTRVANIWLRVKNAEATQEALNKALSHDPNYAPALKGLAEFYYQTKKYAKAKETYIKYLENSEKSAANQTRFAQILFKSKEYEEALNTIEEIQKTGTSNIFLYRLAGYSSYEVADMKKDASKYAAGVSQMEIFFSKVDEKKIITSDYEYLGKLYSKTGKDSLAIITLKKALQLDSSKAEIFKELAMVFNKNKKFAEAIYYFEGALNRTSKPTNADYYLLGRTSYFGKQFTKADSILAIVNQKAPSYPEAYYYRGLAQGFIDPDLKDTTALFCFQTYLNLINVSDPAVVEKLKNNIVQSYDYLGTYCYKKSAKGQESSCKHYFEKIIAIEPGNKKAQEFVKTLK